MTIPTRRSPSSWTTTASGSAPWVGVCGSPIAGARRTSGSRPSRYWTTSVAPERSTRPGSISSSRDTAVSGSAAR